MNRTIELPFEMIDRIVIDELKDALQRSVADGEPLDYETIDGLKASLRYFAPRSEYEPFLRDIALTQMVRESERLGLYNE